METNTEFIEIKEKLKAYLAEKKLLTELARQTGVSIRTVHATFSIKSEKELIGKKLLVWKKAIEIFKEVKSTIDKTQEVLNN